MFTALSIIALFAATLADIVTTRPALRRPNTHEAGLLARLAGPHWIPLRAIGSLVLAAATFLPWFAGGANLARFVLAGLWTGVSLWNLRQGR